MEAFSIFMMLSGAGLFFAFVAKYFIWRRVTKWQEVPGNIVERGMLERKLYMWPSAVDEFVPRVAYEYVYNDVPYRGSAITVRDRSLSSVDKNEIVRYLDGLESPVSVYVNPKDAKQSVLMNEIKWKQLEHVVTYTLVGGLLFLIGFIMFQMF